MTIQAPRYVRVVFLAMAAIIALLGSAVAVPAYAAGPDGVEVTVTSAETGLPILGATVSGTRWNFDGGNIGEFTPVTTDIDGKATLTENFGSAEVDVRASGFLRGTAYLEEPSSGQAVAVSLAAATTSIHGTVRDEQGAAIDGVAVQVSCNDGDCGHYRTTTADGGLYSFPDLGAGEYHFYISKDGYKWATGDVTLFDDDPIQQDFVLTTEGIVEGSVTTVDGTPIEGIQVNLLSVTGGDGGGGAVTDANGNFSFGASAGDWALYYSDGPFYDADTDSFRNPAYETLFLGDVLSLDESETVEVLNGETTIVPVQKLRLGATISGRVSIQTPDGSVNLSPERRPGTNLYREVDGAWEQVFVPSAMAGNASGESAIFGVPAGTYRIGYVDQRVGSPRAFTSQFWNNKPTVETAQDITVSAGEISDGHDSTIVTPEPNFATEEPTEEDFTEENENQELSPDSATLGSTMTLDVGTEYAGEWVSATAHSTPVHLGPDWIQVPSTGTISVTLPSAVVAGDHKIAVQLADSSVLAWSDTTVEALAGSPFTKTTKPTISGTVKVGTKLTAKVAKWTPAATGYTYQWRSDGADIEGATSSTFTPTIELVGTKLTIAVTGSKVGRLSTTTLSKATGSVPTVAMSTKKPTVTGTRKVEHQLTANVGTWATPEVEFTYQWLRNGKKISGATEPIYNLTAGDYKKYITVKVTGSKPAYKTTSVVSSKPKKPTAAGALMTPPFGLAGNTIGSPVTLTGNDWTSEKVKVSYKWKIGNTVIAGATKSTYTPKKASWAGKKLTVIVTGKKTGYVTGTFSASTILTLAE